MVSAFWVFLKIHLEETEKDRLVAIVCCESLQSSFPGSSRKWKSMLLLLHGGIA